MYSGQLISDFQAVFKQSIWDFASIRFGFDWEKFNKFLGNSSLKIIDFLITNLGPKAARVCQQISHEEARLLIDHAINGLNQLSTDGKGTYQIAVHKHQSPFFPAEIIEVAGSIAKPYGIRRIDGFWSLDHLDTGKTVAIKATKKECQALIRNLQVHYPSKDITQIDKFELLRFLS